MKRMAVGLTMWLALGGAWAQQVWRCEVDGQVRYTDRPCEKSSQPLPARALHANVVESLTTETARAAQAASAASDVPASAPLVAAGAASAPSAASSVNTACTGDGEVSGPETRPGTCRQEAVDRPADAGSAVIQHAAVTQPRRVGRARADSPWQRPAPQGLLQTDFVQRGYVPRRQNPASTPTP